MRGWVDALAIVACMACAACGSSDARSTLDAMGDAPHDGDLGDARVDDAGDDGATETSGDVDVARTCKLDGCVLSIPIPPTPIAGISPPLTLCLAGVQRNADPARCVADVAIGAARWTHDVTGHPAASTTLDVIAFDATIDSTDPSVHFHRDMLVSDTSGCPNTGFEPASVVVHASVVPSAPMCGGVDDTTVTIDPSTFPLHPCPNFGTVDDASLAVAAQKYVARAIAAGMRDALRTAACLQ